MRAAPRLTLRRATPADADLLLAWRNDPSTRRWFLDGRPVPPQAHAAWFARTLAHAGSRLYIAQVDRRPVGQLRLETRGKDAVEISLSVDRRARGRGLGAALLRRAGSLARRELGAAVLVAYVLPENVASAVAFLQAGYRFSGLRLRAGRPTYAFELPIAPGPLRGGRPGASRRASAQARRINRPPGGGLN